MGRNLSKGRFDLVSEEKIILEESWKRKRTLISISITSVATKSGNI